METPAPDLDQSKNMPLNMLQPMLSGRAKRAVPSLWIPIEGGTPSLRSGIPRSEGVPPSMETPAPDLDQSKNMPLNMLQPMLSGRAKRAVPSLWIPIEGGTPSLRSGIPRSEGVPPSMETPAPDLNQPAASSLPRHSAG